MDGSTGTVRQTELYTPLQLNHGCAKTSAEQNVKNGQLSGQQINTLCKHWLELKIVLSKVNTFFIKKGSSLNLNRWIQDCAMSKGMLLDVLQKRRHLE